MTFDVLGIPVAQGRPKFTTRSGYGRAYDPKKSVQGKHDFKMQSLKYRPKELIKEAIQLDIIFYLPRPKSLPKKVIYHTKKPDIDNLVKLCCDSMKGIFFIDDSQIIRLNAKKRYCIEGHPSMTRVIIQVIDKNAVVD